MGNQSKEQKMVDSICSAYRSLYVPTESSHKVKGPTTKCDIALKWNGTIYYLEAKHYDSNNEANYPKQLMAECLINRKYHKKANTFGILVDCDQSQSSKILKYITEHIDKDDWEVFGDVFNCKAIFLYDETSKALYFQDWNDLFNLQRNIVHINKQ